MLIDTKETKPNAIGRTLPHRKVFDINGKLFYLEPANLLLREIFADTVTSTEEEDAFRRGNKCAQGINADGRIIYMDKYGMVF